MPSPQTYATPLQNKLAGILTILFFAGIVATGFVMNLFEDTFIPLYITLLVLIIPGVVITPLVFKILLPAGSKYIIGKFVVITVLDVMAFGGILLYTFMAINFYDVDAGRATGQKLPIISSGFNLYKSSKIPYANISYKGQIKQFEFSSDGPPASDYRFLQMDINKGYFGFDVIKSKKLVK